MNVDTLQTQSLYISGIINVRYVIVNCYSIYPCKGQFSTTGTINVNESSYISFDELILYSDSSISKQYTILTYPVQNYSTINYDSLSISPYSNNYEISIINGSTSFIINVNYLPNNNFPTYLVIISIVAVSILLTLFSIMAIYYLCVKTNKYNNCNNCNKCRNVVTI